ncbi:MerR family transcriptional regulator [Nonomuraea sp. NPDC049714]|uniref:MerR family transcriptional regulator n=1 Tax=Nonomuraea sp. NPDC049714 TaxID=3364357 RepID=UPI0037BA2FE4
MSDTWTIGELAEHAADALRAHGQPLNGRVRDVPGERLIRWYTTIGLVDPPLSRRGRIARYGRRHLLQLVAVKRMQAGGMSIADIQATLAGATDAMLEEAAGSGAQRPAPAAPPPDGQATRFWTRSPADTASARPDTMPGTMPGTTTGTTTEGDGAGEGAAGAPVRGVRLGGGVSLLFDGAGRTLTKDDVQAVLAAAGPLLAVLEERKLT